MWPISAVRLASAQLACSAAGGTAARSSANTASRSSPRAWQTVASGTLPPQQKSIWWCWKTGIVAGAVAAISATVRSGVSVMVEILAIERTTHRLTSSGDRVVALAQTADAAIGCEALPALAGRAAAGNSLCAR